MNVRVLTTLGLTAALVAACGDSETKTTPDAGMTDPDGGSPDGGSPDGGGGDAGTPDMGSGEGVIECENDAIPAAPEGSTCAVTAGAGTSTLLRGTVIAPNGLLKNGHVLVGSDGLISCAACDCSAAPGFADATVVACAQGVISPGLINAHEHVTFGEGKPIDTGDTRFDHRHEWRTGARGARDLDTPSSSSGSGPVLYAELRHLLGGATSIAGSGGAGGLLRNVDRSGELQEGLNVSQARYSTFPLGDASGTLRESGCSYGGLDSPNDSNIANALSYLPHISEGIDTAARNEFLCLSRAENGGEDVILDKTAFIHGVGMNAIDYGVAAADGASLVWSPRTNISLYGITAPVTTARALGVNIAMGTDWPSSGSMNMLRELRCAADLNARNYGGAFTDRELVDMATANGAAALKLDAKIGSLAPGLEADISVFDATGREGYSALFDGEPASVALVLRSGAALYGDEDTVRALRDAGCENLDVCGRAKQVCALGDSGTGLADIIASVNSAETIQLFSCGVPPGEPTCIPFRTGEFMGVGTDGDQDGDGVMDMLDNCPTVFNPVRPLDGTDQANADSDGDGDACDVCPLDADSDTCEPPDPNDRDGDGFVNAMDNCPDQANPGQEDGDSDMIGDVCDRCPAFSNPGDGACPASIYDVKQGNVDGAVLLSNALVSAVNSNGYFMQVVAGDDGYDDALGANYSGVFVFDRTSERPAVGDRVNVEGSVNVYFGQTQIEAQTLTVSASTGMGPEPILVTPIEVATGGDKAEALEGVLVEVRGVTVTDPAPDGGQYNEFVVSDGLRVDDYFYLLDPFPVQDQVFGYIRGPLRFANSASKINPRDANDVDQSAVLVSLSSDDQFALENQAAAATFRLTLNRSVDAATAVSIAATGPISAPATVTVPAGADHVDFSVDTQAASTTAATLTATLDMSSVMANLRVYSETEARQVVELRLDAPSVVPSATVDATVVLDLPAPTGGQMVSVSFTPALATAPAVVVAAGAFEASFTITAGASQGTTTVEASVGASSAQAMLQISSVSMGVPTAAGDIAITEIMKNPLTSGDPDEWFEIYNPSPSVIYELSGCVVTDDGGDTFTINSSVVVQPGGFVVLAKDANPGFTPDYVWTGMNMGNGDDEVIITCNGTIIDQVYYTDAAYPDDQGAAMQLDPSFIGPNAATDNDVGANFCSASNVYNGMDSGTPGAINPACP